MTSNEETIKYYYIDTEKLNLSNLDLKKKISMTLPAINEDLLEKDSKSESDDEDKLQNNELDCDYDKKSEDDDDS